MFARLIAAARERDGLWQRWGAPVAAFVVVMVAAEVLRGYAQRAADEWTDQRDQVDKLVRLYGEARDTYWHVRAAVERQTETGDVLPDRKSVV